MRKTPSFHTLYAVIYAPNHSVIFRIALPLWLMAFFSSAFISENVLDSPTGMKMGS
jgi:hypothetical protein